MRGRKIANDFSFHLVGVTFFQAAIRQKLAQEKIAPIQNQRTPIPFKALLPDENEKNLKPEEKEKLDNQRKKVISLLLDKKTDRDAAHDEPFTLFTSLGAEEEMQNLALEQRILLAASKK